MVMIQDRGSVYVVAMPFNHGMGKAIKWLDQQGIDYRWKNCKNTESFDTVDKIIEYHFKSSQDAMLFLLRWRCL
jgi:hypothetical protein